jgi:hypothetical protein
MDTEQIEAPAAASEQLSAAEAKIAGARDYLATFAAQIVAETGSQPLVMEDPPVAEPPEVPITPPKPPESPEQPEPPKPTEPETPEPEAEDEAPEMAYLPPEVQTAINKRIGKEVARRKAADEARTAAEARAAELETQAGLTGERRVIDSASPMSQVNDFTTLAQRKAQTESLLEQTRDLLDSVEDEPDKVAASLAAGGITLVEPTPAAMRKSLRLIEKNLKRTLETHIPARESFLNAEAETQARVLTVFPDLKNPASQRAKILAEVLARHPEMRFSATWPALAAAAVEGILKINEEGQKKAKATSDKPKPPPAIPARPWSASASAGPREKAVARQAAQTRAAYFGDGEARVAVLQRILDRQKVD